MSRKSKYDTHVKHRLKEVAAWCRDGLIDVQIVKKLGVGLTSFYQYQKDHPELIEVLKKNKEVVDIEVENSTLKSAHGYEVVETTKEMRLNPDTEKYELVVIKEVIKHVPPNVTAQIFWLKNRKPEQWSDRHDINHNFVGPAKIEFTDNSEVEEEEEIKEENE